MASFASFETSVGLQDFDEFRKALRRLDKAESARLIKDVNRSVGDMVVRKAKTKARTLSVRSLAGNSLGALYRKVAAKDIRRTQSQTKASIKIGKKSTPYALGAEFGALGHRQFARWRGNQWPSTRRYAPTPGYIIQPTLRETEDEVVEFYQAAFADVFSRIMKVER